MNIKHITSLRNSRTSGMANIIPHHINWQSKYTNVHWVNIGSDYIPPQELIKCYKDGCHDSDEDVIMFAGNLLPDLVIFHGIFFARYCRIAKLLTKIKVPYIVVPHGSLTKHSLKQKNIKKRVAFFIMFGEFLRNALTIQYLTAGERDASKNEWNKRSIVVPNGCKEFDRHKISYNSRTLKGVFIGRKSIFYKGLDILLEACYELKPYLLDNNVTIDLYGPDRNGSEYKLPNLIEMYGLRQVITLKPGVYDEDKERVLLESDFFILTSRTEGHPVALVEALSYGLPCLVTTGTNMADEVLAYDAGWTAGCNPDSIACSLKRVIAEKDRFKSKGCNALKLAQNYAWPKVAQGAIDHYKALCKELEDW